MDDSEFRDWDRSILLANGYTSDEIRDRDFYSRHMMIRNNCPGYEIGNFYSSSDEE